MSRIIASIVYTVVLPVWFALVSKWTAIGLQKCCQRDPSFESGEMTALGMLGVAVIALILSLLGLLQTPRRVVVLWVCVTGAAVTLSVVT